MFLNPIANPLPRTTWLISETFPAPPGRASGSCSGGGAGSSAVRRISVSTGAAPAITWPVIMRSPERSAFRTLSCTGSMPSLAASRSICASCAKQAWTAPKPRRVPMDVADEGLLASVPHLDGTPRLERQQASMYVDGEVFAGTERATHAGEVQPHACLRQPEAGGDLLQVDVQRLRGDVEGHPPVSRDGQSRLRAQRRLVLLADLVVARDLDLGPRLPVARADDEVAQRFAQDQRLDGVGKRLEPFVVDVDLQRRRPCELRVLGRYERDRLAGIP